MSTKTKTCTKCMATKATNEFPRHRGTRDGLDSWCKACARARRQKMYWRDPEKARARSRRYCRENREKERIRGAEWRRKHPEKARACRYKWYWNDPKGARARRRKYGRENREKERASCARYRRGHPEKVRAYRVRYRQEHRAACLARERIYTVKHRERRKAKDRAYYQMVALMPKRTPATKACRACRATKPSTAFYRNNHSKDGLTNVCMSCAKAKAVEDARRHRTYSGVGAGLNQWKMQKSKEQEGMVRVSTPQGWVLVPREFTL